MIWTSVSGSTLLDERGGSVGRMALFTDITDRKRAEQAQELAQQQYSRMFNLVTEGFGHYQAVYDSRGKLIDLVVLEVNPAGARMSGIARDAQIGRRWRQLWPDIDETLFAKYQEADESRLPVQFDDFDKLTGSIYSVLISRVEPGEFVVTFSDVTERKRDEQALRENEERLSLAMDSTELGAFDYYPQTGRLVWSDCAKRHFGLSPDRDVTYDLFLRGLHPEDRERVDQLVRNVLQPEYSGQYATEYRTIGIEDGKERWLSARGRVFFDPGGNAVRFIGVTQDITERKRSRSELLDSKERLALALEAAELGTWEVDLSTGTATASARTCGMFDFDTPAPTTEEWVARVHPEDREETRRKIQAAISGPARYDSAYRVVHRDGSVVSVSAKAVPVFDEDAGRALRLAGVAQDVTAQKQVEEIRERERELLRGIVDNIPVLLCVYDPALKSFELNPEFERVLGWTAEDALCGDFLSKVFPDPVLRRWWRSRRSRSRRAGGNLRPLQRTVHESHPSGPACGCRTSG